MEQLSRRFMRGVAWVVLGGVVSRVLALLSSILVARILGRESFGLLGVVQSTLMLFQTLGGFGTGMTATKYVAENRETDPYRTARMLVLCHAVALVAGLAAAGWLLFASPWIAVRMGVEPAAAPALQVGAAFVFWGVLLGVEQGILGGFERFRSLSVVNIVTGVVGLVAAVVGARVAGVQGVICGGAVTSFCGVMVCLLFLRMNGLWPGQRRWIADSVAEMRILVTYSLPVVLTYSIVAGVAWGSNVILLRHPAAYAELAVVNASNQWRSAYLFVPSLVGQVALPIMADLRGRGDLLQAGAAQELLLKFNSILGAAMLLVFGIAGPSILGAYGSEYRTYWGSFVVLQTAAFVQLLQAPVVKLWEASSRMWLNFVANLLWAAAVLCSAVLFVGLGAMGFSISQLVGFLVFWAVILVVRERPRPDNSGV